MAKAEMNSTKENRERKEAVERLQKEVNTDLLWNAIIAFQNYPFFTYSGLPFSYTVKVGRNGKLNKESKIAGCGCFYRTDAAADAEHVQNSPFCFGQ